MELITDTFVLVAADCPVSAGTVPVPRGATPTVAAPTVIDGPVTGDLSVAYAEQQLVPAFRTVRAWVAGRADRLRLFFLPPYCPEPSPTG